MAHTYEEPGFEGKSEPPLLLMPELHTHYSEKDICTVRRPCPSTGGGHGVDVDSRLLLRALVLVISHLYPSNWIFQCPKLLTPMRRLDSKAKASLNSSLPPQKSGRDQLRIGDPTARQGLLLKPENTTEDIVRFLLLFQWDQGL